MSQDHQEPPFCADGCGFYGNPATRSLCSKCYASFLVRQTSLKIESSLERLTLSSNGAIVIKDVTTCDDSSSGGTSTDDTKTKKKKKNRCDVCKKRVGLIGFSCRCGGVFCGTHRYPEEHSCGFDNKGYAREVLSKTLLTVKADKLGHRG